MRRENYYLYGMKWNKILFLDVDGVINIPPYERFDEDCLNNLRRIIEQTKCKIVVSSSWRTGDLEKTKKHFPEDLREHIVGETIRGYHYVKEKSSLPIVRGNEIKHFVDRSLIYPWHNHPELDAEYSIKDEEGKFIKMKSNRPNVDFTYVILDDDNDMLMEQANHFIQTNPKNGITEIVSSRAISKLNLI